MPYKWLVAAVFVSALFIDILDTTIVNVALPDRRRVPRPRPIEWVVPGYLLSLAVWIPASGWIGDRFGTKRMFLFALALFLGGSALCGLAQNSVSSSPSVSSRASAAACSRRSAPRCCSAPSRRSSGRGRRRRDGADGGRAGARPGARRLPGRHSRLALDLLRQRAHRHRRARFGLSSCASTLRGSPDRFDIPGFVLSGRRAGSIVFAVSEGPQGGWDDPVGARPGDRRRRRVRPWCSWRPARPEPMLALRLLRERLFRRHQHRLGVQHGSFLGVIFLMPLYLQSLRGFTRSVGLTTFPQALGVIISCQIVGRLYPASGRAG